MPASPRIVVSTLAALLSIGSAYPAAAEISAHALRFYGTGTNQDDRVLLPVDDNGPGPDASETIDVGDGSFTFELWLRGALVDNNTTNSGGDVESFNYNWIHGNIFLDRDIWCGSERKFGASLAGGLIRFGVSFGDQQPPGATVTIEGSDPVLDDAWHHVALVRDAADGRLRIFVDGQLDFESSPGLSSVDLSYPDAGVPVTQNCATGQLTPCGWYLVLAAEKHDAGPAYPSFNGFLDEIRIWSVARSATDIADTWRLVLPPDTAGLVGNYRFEEGAGTTVSDSSAAGGPDGELRIGVAGNGEWVARSAYPANTAPVLPLVVFTDGFESGDTSAWTGSSVLVEILVHQPAGRL